MGGSRFIDDAVGLLDGDGIDDIGHYGGLLGAVTHGLPPRLVLVASFGAPTASRHPGKLADTARISASPRSSPLCRETCRTVTICLPVVLIQSPIPFHLQS